MLEIIIAYDKHGKKTKDSKFMIAKHCIDVNQNIFFIKATYNGYLYNMYDPFYVSGDEHSMCKKRGEPLFTFKKVNENCYTLYVKFLTSRHIAFLRQAERIL